MSKKSVFTVANLSHVFFNRASTDGRAGAYAGIVAGGAMLTHDRTRRAHVPAAVFVPGVVGRPFAVIAPCADDARWTPAQLENDVPPDAVQCVKLARWPELLRLEWIEAARVLDVPGSCSTEHARMRAGVTMLAGVAPLTRAYVLSIANAARSSIISASDSCGEQNSIERVRDYVKTARDLLALEWEDKAEHARVSSEFERMCERWQVHAARGLADLTTIRAVAQAERAIEDAGESLAKVRDYFTARQSVRTPRELAEHVAKHRASNLSESIAAILRAGIAFGGVGLEVVPKNAGAAIAEDCARVHRIANMNAAMRWAYHRGAAVFTVAEVPRGLREEYARRKKQEVNARQREERKQEAARRALNVRIAPAILGRFHAIRAALEALPADADAYATREALTDIPSVPDAPQSCANGPILTASTLSEFATLAARVPVVMLNIANFKEAEFTRHGARQLSPSCARELASIRELCADIDTKPLQDAAHRMQSEQGRMDRARRFQLALDKVDAATPRASAERLRQFSSGWEVSRAFYQHASDETRADVFGREFPQLFARYADALALLDRAKDAISEYAEWASGGNPPSGRGDHMRLTLDGRRVVTNRGAEVSTRAVRAALAFIDSQEAGAFSCDFEIGAFRLMGRNAEGFIRVGCHQFSPEAVQAIRAAIDANSQGVK